MTKLIALMIIAALMGCTVGNMRITEESAVYKKEWVKEKGEPPTQAESFERKWHWESA